MHQAWPVAAAPARQGAERRDEVQHAANGPIGPIAGDEVEPVSGPKGRGHQLAQHGLHAADAVGVGPYVGDLGAVGRFRRHIGVNEAAQAQLATRPEVETGRSDGAGRCAGTRLDPWVGPTYTFVLDGRARMVTRTGWYRSFVALL